MRRLAGLAAVLALLFVGCGGGDDDSDPLAGGPADTGADPHAGHGDDAGSAAEDCAPSATLTVAAKDVKFDKACLAAPPGRAFTLTFENKDALPHNVAILRSHESTETLFSGDLVTGPDRSATYDVPALPAGTYHFHCNVHPDQMNGSFVVK